MQDPDYYTRIERQYKCVAAINCIQYTNELKKAMVYAFSNFFICADSSQAQLLQSNKINAVTLSGDIFRTSGIVTGGYSPVGMSKVKNVSILKEKQQQIKELQSQIQKDAEELAQMSEKIAEIPRLDAEIRKKESEIQSLKRENNPEVRKNQIVQKLQSLEEEIADLKERTDQIKLDVKDADKEKKELDGSLQKRKSSTGNPIEKLKKDSEALKGQIKKLSDTINEAEQQKQGAEKKVKQTLEEQKSLQDSIDAIKEKQRSLEVKISETQNAYDEALLEETELKGLREGLSMEIQTKDQEFKAFKDALVRVQATMESLE